MHDCIVLGTGGLGCAALYSAAKKGWKVLGIDQFGPAHNLGSSHGQTRMIRRTYFEHPNYVPLAQKSFEYWDQLQVLTTESLIRRCGLLQVGNPDGAVIQGVLKSASDHDLAHSQLNVEEIRSKFPLFKPDAGQVGVFEEDAGFLRVEKCVATLIKLAKDHGAEYAASTKIERWESNDDGTFSVFAGDQVFHAKHLVITAGAWANDLLSELGISLRVVRKQQQWFQSDRVDMHVETGFPCFLIETESKDWFYGVPAIDKLGMKIAEHTGGQAIAHPDQLEREINQHDLDRVQGFVDRYIDFGRSRVIYHSACMYTFSEDEHFILDHHPAHPNVVFAAGMSGHGFKFAPLLGEQLIGMLEGKSDPNCEFLKLNRFQNAD